MFNYIVFDCETGGLDKKEQLHAIKHPITEIAAIGLNGSSFEELGRYEAFLKPYYNKDHTYQDEALTFTGIKMYDLEKKGKEAKEVARELSNLFMACSGTKKYERPILVGHNVTFDIPFLQHLFEITKIDLSKYLNGYRDHKGTFTPIYFDTMYLSRLKWIEDMHKHNLKDTTERAGIDLIDAHRAMADVVATVELMAFYANNIRSAAGVQQGEGNIKSYRENFKFEY